MVRTTVHIELFQSTESTEDRGVQTEDVFDEMDSSERTCPRWFVRCCAMGVVRNDEMNKLNDYKCNPPPIFTLMISLIELIVFIVYVVELKDSDTPVTWNKGFPIYSPFVYKPTKRHEAWRFLTYMLIHSGWTHILINLIVQLALGIIFEMFHTSKVIAPLYLAGVLTGSLFHSVVDYDVNLVGASGGVFALLGAHLASTIINWDYLNYRSCNKTEDLEDVCQLVLSAWLRLIIVLSVGGLSFGISIYERYYVDDPNSNKVGIAAHGGGFVAGLFLGVAIARNKTKEQWERDCGIGFCVLFGILVVGAIFFNIFYDGYPPAEY